MTKFTIRQATERDVEKILYFLRNLAAYQKMTDDVAVTEDELKEWLFHRRVAEVILAEEDDHEVGVAIFYTHFATFIGRGGLYIEDLYVSPEYRGKGYGKALFRRLAQIAVERDYCRLEWRCLNWNQSSIDFYHSLGARELDDWTTFNLSGQAISALAGSGSRDCND